MADRADRCQHRDAEVLRSYYDRQGKPRRQHRFNGCGRQDDLRVDLYGYAYCADHRADGDYGPAAAEVDIAAVLDQLLGR